jgi:hypothetical protein
MKGKLFTEEQISYVLCQAERHAGGECLPAAGRAQGELLILEQEVPQAPCDGDLRDAAVAQPRFGYEQQPRPLRALGRGNGLSKRSACMWCG